MFLGHQLGDLVDFSVDLVNFLRRPYFLSLFLHLLSIYIKTIVHYSISTASSIPFLHSQHLQLEVHLTPLLKHSQYFLRQFDFIQLQPLFQEFFLANNNFKFWEFSDIMILSVFLSLFDLTRCQNCSLRIALRRERDWKSRIDPK